MEYSSNFKDSRIGVYCLAPYARTERHIEEMKACGIDFVLAVDADRNLLDLLHKFQMGALVCGVVPGWFGGMGENAGKLQETNPLDRYHSGAQNFADHPAIWGIDVGDEPSSLDFPYYGQVVQLVSQLFPTKFPYLNLYPNYAMLAQNTPEEIRNQLGTDNYEEYIAKYCQYVPTDYISFDFYPYSRNIHDFFQNLVTVSQACQTHNKSMWAVLQVNSSDPDCWISKNQLRFQAFSAMAFGAEKISWACYTAGWWHNQVLDSSGEKTQQYEKLSIINQEIKTLFQLRKNYTHCTTHFIGLDFSNHWITHLKTASDELLLAEELVDSKTQGNALFLLPCSDPYDQNPHSLTLTFHSYFPKIQATRSSGNQETLIRQNGIFTLYLQTNEAIWLIPEER